MDGQWLWLLISEVHSSNPFIVKIFMINIFTAEKTKINKNDARNGPVNNNSFNLLLLLKISMKKPRPGPYMNEFLAGNDFYDSWM